jgi:hypothetical protein
VSNALAIAGVTAVLRDLLNDGLINHNVSGALGSTVTVSALPPDRLAAPNGSEATQLNLFLHQVTPNQGWRNEGLPSRDASGRTRLSNPPLALDLHYLLSARGAEELHAEILLGYAMQLLHESPVLLRSAITTALNPSPPVGTTLPPALRALADSGLADQVEQIKITPEYLSTEEMSKLWTAVQSHYRPSAAYLATVVLIESSRPSRATLPVLSRTIVATPSLVPPFPVIQSVLAHKKQPAASVGAMVDVAGHHLDGTDKFILLSNARFQIEQAVPAAAGGSSTMMQFVVPDLPVGIYQLAVRLIAPGEPEPRTSNQLALIVGPEIVSPLPMAVARDGTGTATIPIDCQPQIRPGQKVSLLFGTREVFAEPFAAATGTVTFIVKTAPAGEFLVRLRVEGIDSPLIDLEAKPPVFLDRKIVIT